MMINCGRCRMRGDGCPDCVITALGPAKGGTFPAESPGYLPEAEVKALGVLAAAGLVPPLQFSLVARADRPGARAWARRAFPGSKAS